MASFSTFRSPKTICYGAGALEKLGDIVEDLRCSKALIITDQIMMKLGYPEQCRKILEDRSIGCAFYAEVTSEPVDHFVTDALAIYKQERCDFLVSVGGGSCIDAAKAVAVVATNGGYIGDYMGLKKIADWPPVPHIAIPTTAGTGSEATDATIITDTTNDVKMMIKQPAFAPDAAIVDPVLTVSSPKSVTAATGVDALCHAIESYLSSLAHPMTDTLAVSAMRLISANIETAYNNGKEMGAREAMSLGALQAGIAFSNSSVCLVHGMSRPIGALFHVPHGVSNAMLLPAVLEFSRDSCTKRLADIGRIIAPANNERADEEAADAAIAAVKKLCRNLRIPNIKAWGIEKKAFDRVIKKMAGDALASGSPANNPKVPSQKEIEKLYQTCYDYDFS
ncbi:iron-containing alcohol dehydrogenase [Sporolactobacillus sp. THM7-7]|nr:iron-containing alcohol dehydrogenase [Sporolactobacillus sp. THM7-7]